MNKKVLLLIAVLLCGIGHESVAQEKSKTWTLQAGIGYGHTEHVGESFASGFYVGKRLFDVIEVGFTIDHMLCQNKGYGYSYAEATTLPYHYLHISQHEEDTWIRHESGSATSYMAVLGISPIKLIWKNSRHDLLLAVQAGFSYVHGIYLYRDVEKMHLLAHTYSNREFVYAPRLAYEYRISDTLGAGVTAMYKFGSAASYGALATFNVHF